VNGSRQVFGGGGGQIGVDHHPRAPVQPGGGHGGSGRKIESAFGWLANDRGTPALRPLGNPLIAGNNGDAAACCSSLGDDMTGDRLADLTPLVGIEHRP
jgi:hypothetical protein